MCLAQEEGGKVSLLMAAYKRTLFMKSQRFGKSYLVKERNMLA